MHTASFKGFSLIELLLSLGIFVILIGITSAAWGSFDDSRKHSRVQRDFELFSSALEVYYLHRGHYPESLDLLVQDRVALGIASLNFIDPWGHPYFYKPLGAQFTRFTLLSAGPDGGLSTGEDNILFHLF